MELIESHNRRPHVTFFDGLELGAKGIRDRARCSRAAAAWIEPQPRILANAVIPRRLGSIERGSASLAVGTASRNGLRPRWPLDLDGDCAFSPATEIVGWGSPGETPVVGGWDADGDDDIGVYSGGLWIIDANGDRQFQPATEAVGWGAPGWTLLIGARK